MTRFFALAGLILISSCKVKYPISDSEFNRISNNKILFVNYLIKESNGKVTATFVNQITSDGLMKNTGENKTYGLNGDIEVSQLSEKRKVLHKFYVSNPLFTTVEFVNDSGRMEKRSFELDSAQVCVRMQLDSNAVFLQLKRYSIEKESIKLLETRIE